VKDIFSIAKTFLSEQTIRAGKKFYHSSVEPIKVLEHKPLWFALNLKDASGWFANAAEEGSAYLYEATFAKPILHIDDYNVIEIFEELGEDPYDWVDMIVGNPTSKEVLSDKATKALIADGHIGLVYPDYDPRDSQSDLDACIIFDAKSSIKTWKLIKNK
jgi:hypothetical protein